MTNIIINKIKTFKHEKFKLFNTELKQFLISNANNITLDKRLFSIYYLLSCHVCFDDVITSFDRMLQNKRLYTFNELMIVRLLKLKLESSVFWLNKIIKG